MTKTMREEMKLTKKEGVLLKNADWLEKTDKVISLYKSNQTHRWTGRVGASTREDYLVIEAETLQKLLSNIETEMCGEKLKISQNK